MKLKFSIAAALAVASFSATADGRITSLSSAVANSGTAGGSCLVRGDGGAGVTLECAGDPRFDRQVLAALNTLPQDYVANLNEEVWTTGFRGAARAGGDIRLVRAVDSGGRATRPTSPDAFQLAAPVAEPAAPTYALLGKARSAHVPDFVVPVKIGEHAGQDYLVAGPYPSPTVATRRLAALGVFPVGLVDASLVALR